MEEKFSVRDFSLNSLGSVDISAKVRETDKFDSAR
jgi:hypothetical protein